MSDTFAMFSTYSEKYPDETMRFIMADWLEERDDPRGQWLRDDTLYPLMGRRLENPIPQLIPRLHEEKIASLIKKIGLPTATWLTTEFLTNASNRRSEAEKLLKLIIKPDPKAIRIAQKLQSDDLAIKYQTLKSLRDMKEKAIFAIPAIIEAIQDSDRHLQVDAIETLGQMGDIADAALLECDWYGTWIYHDVAARLGPKSRAMIILVSNLGASDADAWESSLNHLKSLGIEVVDQVLDGYRRVDSDRMPRCYMALQEMPDSDHLLVAAADNSLLSNGQRATAIEALYYYNTEYDYLDQDRDWLVPHLKRWECSDRPEISEAAKHGLELFAQRDELERPLSDREIEEVRLRLEDSEPEVRLQQWNQFPEYIQQFPDFLELFSRGLEDRDVSVRAAVVNQCYENFHFWSDPILVVPIIQKALTDHSAEVRSVALNFRSGSRETFQQLLPGFLGMYQAEKQIDVKLKALKLIGGRLVAKNQTPQVLYEQFLSCLMADLNHPTLEIQIAVAEVIMVSEDDIFKKFEKALLTVIENDQTKLSSTILSLWSRRSAPHTQVLNALRTRLVGSPEDRSVYIYEAMNNLKYVPTQAELPLFTDSNDIPRQASEILVRKGAKAVPHLLKILRKGKKDWNRSVVYILSEIGRPAARQALPILFELLEINEPDYHSSNLLHMTAKIAEPMEFVARIPKWLFYPDASFQWTIIRICNEAGIAARPLWSDFLKLAKTFDAPTVAMAEIIKAEPTLLEDVLTLLDLSGPGRKNALQIFRHTGISAKPALKRLKQLAREEPLDDEIANTLKAVEGK